MHKIQPEIIEYVEFKALPNISDEQVFNALKATDAVLDSVKGYRRRIVAKHANIFVEVVFWDSQEEATRGLEVFSNDERAAKLFELIDTDSVSIKYSNIVEL